MWDLSTDFLPLASFVAGISGSLHCLGMCGGLVTASCHSGKDVLKYQVGRFIGYGAVGSLAWLMGESVKNVLNLPGVSIASGLLIGLLFIFWGVQSYQGKKAELPTPKFLRKIYQFAFKNFALQKRATRSFVIGLISILLPCGLIYGLIIASLAFGNYEQVIGSLFFFWLGTLPAMMGAPQIVKKILSPLRSRLPKVYALIFIVVGVATISGRLGQVNFNTSEQSNASKQTIKKCH